MKPEKEHKSKRKKEKKSSKKRRSQKKLLNQLKLISLAQLGDVNKVEEFLASQGVEAISLYDSEGSTPLHQACRGGHYEVVECLLRHGADVRAEDFQGNTPVHIAAQYDKVAILPLLLQATRAPNIDACNAAGVSARELIEAAMHAQEVRDHQAKKRKLHADESSEWERLMEEDGPPDEMDEGPMHYNSGDEWEERLREEGGAGEDADEWGWSSFGGAWNYGNGEAEAEMDEDEYAQRVWERMEQKRRAGNRASAAAREQWGKADDASARRQARAKEAEERSRKILEEERAREAAWRQAVLKGNVGARRARYEATWHTFVTAIAGGKKGLKYADIPWPAEDPDDARAIVLYGTTTPAEVRKRIRQELLRWHEDKFAKYQDRLDSSDSQRILQGVKAVSQMLNHLASTSTA
ncbi:probable unconventional myosin-XVI at N-terminal half [Coccomyxa sp. Obi]|nr:probable unconventional myosin-XVI at N-terminal half [Coccomyxa sp. Obi]